MPRSQASELRRAAHSSDLAHRVWDLVLRRGGGRRVRMRSRCCGSRWASSANTFRSHADESYPATKVSPSAGAALGAPAPVTRHCRFDRNRRTSRTRACSGSQARRLPKGALRLPIGARRKTAWTPGQPFLSTSFVHASPIRSSGRLASPRLITAARALAGLSQAELAAAAGIPRSSLARYEAGVRSLRLSTFEAIVAALRKHGVRFLEETDEVAMGVFITKGPEARTDE